MPSTYDADAAGIFLLQLEINIAKTFQLSSAQFALPALLITSVKRLITIDDDDADFAAAAVADSVSTASCELCLRLVFSCDVIQVVCLLRAHSKSPHGYYS